MQIFFPIQKIMLSNVYVYKSYLNIARVLARFREPPRVNQCVRVLVKLSTRIIQIPFLFSAKSHNSIGIGLFFLKIYMSFEDGCS